MVVIVAEKHVHTNKQRLVLGSMFYLQEAAEERALWSHDLASWLDQDKNYKVNQLSILAMLNKFHTVDVVDKMWEQFETVVRRPPRTYHRLTEYGGRLAIGAIQQLRILDPLPVWIRIPELEDGAWQPEWPEDFALSPPEGHLVEIPLDNPEAP